MTPHVAVLGAGILGSSTALFLSRRGCRVTLIDAAGSPFQGASRWNEGKVHLGFIYAGDPTLATAKRIIPGGLVFKPLVEQLVGTSLRDATTPREDTYLIHRDSVVGLETAERYFHEVSALVRSSPEAGSYLTDVRSCQTQRLTKRELEALTGSEAVVGGLRVPERSVDTRWLADRYAAALLAEPRIEQVMGTRVLGVIPKLDGRWGLNTTEGLHGPFDYVVNSLWEGRLRIDQTLGLRPEGRWTHRFRYAVFIRTRSTVDAESAIVSVGPFGDLKNYNGRDFYLSWYPCGLVAEGNDVDPPPLPPMSEGDRRELAGDIMERLAHYLPTVCAIRERAIDVTLAGGWVFALGQGSLADPTSTLHRRDRIGITRQGTYFSVDTGKFSIAPWLAKEVADAILPETRFHAVAAAQPGENPL